MDLEEHIEEVSEKIGVPLKKHETTPGVGNCWYEACVCLMRLNNMGTMTAKQLRKEVVDNIENCKNFANVFEMIFKSDYEKLAEFKKKHHREGEFTDQDGVIALATGYYLGVTLRIFSRTNTKKQPYTEHNENQPIIFNIFLDDRTSGHFQSLLQPKVNNKQEISSVSEDLEPERTPEEAMQDFYDRYLNTEQEIYKPLKQISVGRLENSKKIKNPSETIDLGKDKVKQTMIEKKKSKDSILEHSNESKKVTPEVPKSQKPTSPKEKRIDTYAEVVKNSKITYMTETKDVTNKIENEKNKSDDMEILTKKLNNNPTKINIDVVKNASINKKSEETLLKTNQETSKHMKDQDIVSQKVEVLNLNTDIEIKTDKYMTQDDIIKEIDDNDIDIKEIKEVAAKAGRCWNCFNSNCSDNCDPTNTNYMWDNQTQNEEEEDYENYPQNNICYECGKQLKWEHMCPDCGISNLDEDEEKVATDTWKEENNATYDHPVYNDPEISNDQDNKTMHSQHPDGATTIEKLNKNSLEVNNGRDHKTMHSKNSDEEAIIENSIKKSPEVNNSQDHKTIHSQHSDEADTTENSNINSSKVNNGRDHKTMHSLKSDKAAIIENYNKKSSEVNNGRDHKTMQSQCSEKTVIIEIPNNHLPKVNNDQGHNTMHPQTPEKSVVVDSPEVLHKEISTNTSNQNKEPIKKIKKEKRKKSKSKPKETTEKRLAIAELEIARQIKNGTKLNKEQASEILDLMKNNRIEINTNTKTEYIKNISNDREKEIFNQLEDGFKTENRIEQKIEPEIELEETDDLCPIGCKTELTDKNFLDHMMKCEKTIENCYRCGPEYMANDIHWDITIHSKITQRFSCMECMKAHATRLRIITNHKSICQDSGKIKLIENRETPEETAALFKDLYTKDKQIRKLLKEDFKKRCIKQRINYNNEIQPTFKIMAIIGMIAMIYAITLCIMKSAQKQDIGYKPTTTKQEFRENPTIVTGNSKPEKETKQKWTTRKRDKELQDWKTSKSLQPDHSNVKENSEYIKQPLEASIIACLTILFSDSRDSSQDNRETMETSSKICLTALLTTLEKNSQNNEESMEAPGKTRQTSDKPIHCQTAQAQSQKKSSKNNEASMEASVRARKTSDKPTRDQTAPTQTLEKSSQDSEESRKASIKACLTILFGNQEEDSQYELMKASRKICLAALSKSMEQIPQNNEEYMKSVDDNTNNQTLKQRSQNNKETMEASSEARQTSDKPINCQTAPAQSSKKSSQNNEAFMKASAEVKKTPDKPIRYQTAPVQISEESSQDIEESRDASVKACLTILFGNPEENPQYELLEASAISCLAALFKAVKQTPYMESVDANNQTASIQILEDSSTKITPTYIVIKNSGIPILISEDNLEIAKTAKCAKNGINNETLDTTLSKETLVHKLLAHMDQVTNL